MAIAARNATIANTDTKQRPRARRALIAAGVIVALVGIGAYAGFSAPPGPPSQRQFEPARLAELELRMWQAYALLYGTSADGVRESGRLRAQAAAREMV